MAKVFDAQGNIVEVPVDPVINDLSLTPTMTELPASYEVAIIVPAADGLKRVVMVSRGTLIADVLQSLSQKKQLTKIGGSYTASYTATLSVALGVQERAVSVPGLVAGEPVQVCVTGASGTNLGVLSSYRVSANDTLVVPMLLPALGIAQTASITFEVYAWR